MKKLTLVCQITALFMLCANVSYASGGDDRGHRRGWGKHHRYHGERYAPPGQYYGQQPPPPPPSYRDGRSHQGLAGGVVGSVLGYEVGNGNPLATGLGAAAGSLIGNEVSGRR
jgi:Glycine zipper 2TM domain